MDKINDCKNDLISELKAAIEIIKRMFPNFKKGEIYKKDEGEWIKLSYSSGRENYTQTQKYIEIN